MGKAIVATQSAASGLAVADDRELLLRENDGEFARAVVELMQDKAKRRPLGEAARQYVLTNHSWERSGQLLQDAYAKTVALAASKSIGTAKA